MNKNNSLSKTTVLLQLPYLLLLVEHDMYMLRDEEHGAEKYTESKTSENGSNAPR